MERTPCTFSARPSGYGDMRTENSAIERVYTTGTHSGQSRSARSTKCGITRCENALCDMSFLLRNDSHVGFPSELIVF